MNPRQFKCPQTWEILAIKGVEEFLDYRSKVFGGRDYPDLGKEADRSLIEQVIKEGNFDLVIFDNLMVLSTVESWDDAAALADMCSWFNFVAKRQNCAVIVMHHAKKDATSYNGSARIGQDFEIVASLQPAKLRTQLAFDQNGPGFTVEFLKMRDQPKGWNGDPINMVFCTDAWRVWEPEDIGKNKFGKKVTNKGIRGRVFQPALQDAARISRSLWGHYSRQYGSVRDKKVSEVGRQV